MIAVKNVSKIYNENKIDEFKALQNISFEVRDNEICGLIGPSGSGKSTMIFMLGGLFKPSSGDIIINDEIITKLSPKFLSKFIRENIGLIFQNFNLLENFSALENILIPTLLSKENKLNNAKALLKEFDLLNKKDTKVHNLSGGEKQRVAIIRALINDPKIILADEPSANLDKSLTLELIEILKRIKKTIIIATHDEIILSSNLIDKKIEFKK